MKRIAILVFFLCGFLNSRSQTVFKSWSGYLYTIKIWDTVSNKSKVTKIPQFPGDLRRFFLDSAYYPDSALNRSIMGTVYFSFTVEKDGSVSNLKLLRGYEKSLEDEAYRVALLMPKWEPGEKNGTKVKAEMFMSVGFFIKASPPERNSSVIYGGAVDSAVIIEH